MKFETWPHLRFTVFNRESANEPTTRPRSKRIRRASDESSRPPKNYQPTRRQKLASAYAIIPEPWGLEAIKRELSLIKQSAVASLAEGLEDTLTLHRLGLFAKIGRSLKATNCIENLNNLLAPKTDRVDRWQNSNQRQPWVASAMREIEPILKKVKGYRHLAELRSAMATAVSNKQNEYVEKASAS